MTLANILQDAVLSSLSVDENALTLGLETDQQQYRLVVYNEYTIKSEPDCPGLLASTVEQVWQSDEAIQITFSSRAWLTVSLSEASYNGPEALVLYDATGTPLVIAN